MDLVFTNSRVTVDCRAVKSIDYVLQGEKAFFCLTLMDSDYCESAVLGIDVDPMNDREICKTKQLIETVVYAALHGSDRIKVDSFIESLSLLCKAIF